MYQIWFLVYFPAVTAYEPEGFQILTSMNSFSWAISRNYYIGPEKQQPSNRILYKLLVPFQANANKFVAFYTEWFWITFYNHFEYYFVESQLPISRLIDVFYRR